MNKEDKKLQKHLVNEMMKVSKTNPDVMIYMQALMESYEKLEQENINIKQQLLENKISLKDVEYQEKIKLKKEIERLNNIINEFENKGYDIAQERADFLLEIKELENIIKEVRNWVKSTIDIIKQQPTGNDEWILERLNGFLGILDKENEE